MKNWTKGKWAVRHYENYNGFSIFAKESMYGCITERWYDTPISEKMNEEMKANAEIIAEAGTVANETGLSPRELKEQRDMLLNSLKEAMSISEKRMVIDKKSVSVFKNIINQCEVKL